MKLLHLHVLVGIPIPARQVSGDIGGARGDMKTDFRLMLLLAMRGSTPLWGTGNLTARTQEDSG